MSPFFQNMFLGGQCQQLVDTPSLFEGEDYGPDRRVLLILYLGNLIDRHVVRLIKVNNF